MTMKKDWSIRKIDHTKIKLKKSKPEQMPIWACPLSNCYTDMRTDSGGRLGAQS
jgi:hypothetical protein